MVRAEQKSLKCAIYTRKSTEEGLEQAFNSLDAQREACEAFAKSQAHEGWQVLPEHYDDGGFSGSNMDRPALSSLLADIESGQIDIVIVYKVDRLSRSLADFVRLIELFDQTGVSFVSVTQQFNTSTSMGRLTLNVLLSFAQFEREVTSERIRDKIAASKKKGMWMGGLVPLGYDRVEKQLVVNEAEAKLVRHIYHRYLALGCVRELKAELDRDGYVSKPRPEHHRSKGQKPFSRGALYTVLKNPVYLGKVHHKGKLHDGKHAAIVNKTIWEEVQAVLARNRSNKASQASAKYPSLLGGLVWDDRGNRMSPTYTRRKNRHYPYYISQAVLQYKEDEGGSVLRVPGKTLEATTTDLLLNFLSSADQILDLLVEIGLSGDRLDHAVQAGAALASDWQSRAISDQITIINELVARVVVSKKTVTIQLDRNCLLIRLAGLALDTKSQQHITLETAVNLRRSGIESKLIYPAGGEPTVHDRSVKALQEALLKSLKWNEDLVSGNVRSIDALIERDRLNPRQVHRLRKLAFLAPDIMERIIAGEVPETLTLERLKKDFPVKWAEQRSHFGLNQASH
jgi:DNA invertase Pin-like site-specific DNA recombinase